MNIQGLIERYEKFKASKKKMTSVDLVLKDLRSLDEPEPLPFKLKDVVGRIRGFDPMTQARWLNDILKELGDDYGSMKYREGYEQGKFEGAWVGNQLKDADKIRRELNQVKVPQCVADWLSNLKSGLFGLNYDSVSSEIYDWVYDTEDNIRKLHLAFVYGYEVEDEKRYRVRFKGLDKDLEYLNFKHGHVWVFSDNIENEEYRTSHTRKQLEEAGFGWVFDCPGIEIEEVE